MIAHCMTIYQMCLIYFCLYCILGPVFTWNSIKMLFWCTKFMLCHSRMYCRLYMENKKTWVIKLVASRIRDYCSVIRDLPLVQTLSPWEHSSDQYDTFISWRGFATRRTWMCSVIINGSVSVTSKFYRTLWHCSRKATCHISRFSRVAGKSWQFLVPLPCLSALTL